MIHIRAERAGDEGAIHDVVWRAFDQQPQEPRLVNLIREQGKVALSLVAELDGEIVGHILLTAITLVPDPGLNCLAIGPVAAAPAYQNQGVGSALMNAAIARCREQGIDALFLLGHPGYYARFGFRATRIDNEYGATDAFMALELRQGCLVEVQALARYLPEFNETGT